MPMDDKGDPWSGATYKGFAGGPASENRAPPRARPRRALLAGGVAGALALGVAFGLMMRPQLISANAPAKPSAPAAAPASAAPAAAAAQVPISMRAPPKPEPIPRAPGKLQTLPPEMAAAARAQAQPPVLTIDPPAPSTSVGAPAVAAAAAPASEEPAPAPRLRASFDCATARPGAEEMICSNATLAAADRQMARAYRRAMASGLDPYDLRQEQRDWVAIREDAARHSERALEDVYDQRIHELNEIADSAPGQGDGE
jgi:uncharacterized protein YecT (DUF1311 family)